MKYSKLMKERIRRAQVLFTELGYEITETENYEDSFTGIIENLSGFQTVFFIDKDSKFLELAFTFTFSHTLNSFLTARLDEIMKICYEYGCYMNFHTDEEDISFSVFSKIYYMGLNYYSLKETLKDFTSCIESLTEAVELHK
ncbi:MAG: hypothetical protein ACLFR1_07280 [Spirochaetia bacterium]